MFVGAHVVFTGTLGLSRAEVAARVALLGGTLQRGVTSKTTILVIGDGFEGHEPQDFPTLVAVMVADMRAQGHPIEILTENEFATRIRNAKSSALAFE
nr:BRCT domain-containing protein [Demequina lutea]